jgi:hypothetical protein
VIAASLEDSLLAMTVVEAVNRNQIDNLFVDAKALRA